MNIILKILLTLWQFPQTIIGIVLLAYYSPVRWYPSSKIPIDGQYYTSKIHGAISLGEIIITSDQHFLPHEYGHTIQSRILGPLYLIVIGIPSLLWAAWWRSAKVKPGYYTFFTEVWADRLSRIRR
jgi:hypothetical protein